MTALLLWAIAWWGAIGAGISLQSVEVEGAGDTASAPAVTLYGETCLIQLRPSFTTLPEALQRMVILHEVGHCVTGGLYHPYCLCVLQNPAFYGEMNAELARTYYAPWREYPWTWERRILPGLAAE